jgi:hypothetical protein
MNQPVHKGELQDGYNYEKENKDRHSLIDHRQIHQAQHSKKTSEDIRKTASPCFKVKA